MDYIRKFWDSQAEKFGTSYKASWCDRYMIDLEIDTISKYIGSNQKVLDVGCANGYSTNRQAWRHSTCRFVGVDYSIEMIKQAKNTLGKYPHTVNVEYFVDDVRDLMLFQNDDDIFDVVYTTRVLINLPTWEEQVKGIKECIRVAKQGGTIIFSEAFWEPMELLNAMRMLKGLGPITMHDFNRYIRQTELTRLIDSMGLRYSINDFSSVYYLGTRFLKQLIYGPNAYMNYTDEINTAFYELEKQFSGGGMGIQQAVVVKK